MIEVWFDGNLAVRKGDYIRVLRGIPHGDRIRASRVENLTSKGIHSSRIEGVLMTSPPHDLSPPPEGTVTSVVHNGENTTHIELVPPLEVSKSFDYDVFICHDARHSDVAQYLDRCVEAWDLVSFIAPPDIFPGSDFVDQLKNALNGSRFIVPILTHEAIRSAWVNQEIGYASRMEKDIKGEIIAVRVPGVEPEGFIRNRQAVIYEKKWEVTFGKLFSTLRPMYEDSAKMQKIGTECSSCAQRLDSPIPEEAALENLRRRSDSLQVSCVHCGAPISLSPFTLLDEKDRKPQDYEVPKTPSEVYGVDHIRLVHSDEVKQTLREWMLQIPHPTRLPECPAGKLPVNRLKVRPPAVRCEESLEIEERTIFSDIWNHVTDKSLKEKWSEFKHAFGEFEGYKRKVYKHFSNIAREILELPIDDRWHTDSITSHLPHFGYNLMLEAVERGESRARESMEWRRETRVQENKVEFWVGASGMIKVAATPESIGEIESEVWSRWDSFLDESLSDKKLASEARGILQRKKDLEDRIVDMRRSIEDLLNYPILPGDCRYLRVDETGIS